MESTNDFVSRSYSISVYCQIILLIVLAVHLTLWLPWVTKREFLLTISRSLMTRIKKNINEGIISRFNLKFSKPTSLELYYRQKGELLMRFCGVKWLSCSISKFMWYSWMALFILGALNKIKTFKLTKYKKLNLLLAWQMCWIMLLWRPRRTVFY